ncbi:restriction endonuclease [Candidatus Magnetoovum chiemensis]|nr:restriction endonuclease [Candidatus Magnetoovum chiemensis]
MEIINGVQVGEPLTEIINGEEIIASVRFCKHQSVLGNLGYAISEHVDKNALGEVFCVPLDVIFDEGINRLQPDFSFIKKENTSIIQDWIRGVPDVVGEVISKGSFKKDVSVKKKIYEKYKVPEYWVVIPDLSMIEVYTLEGDGYEVFSYAEVEGTVKSKVIEGFEIDIKDVFEE